MSASPFGGPDGEFDPPALKNINLTIEPGERVGFLGATGAGKTALVNLLPRFYDVTEGASPSTAWMSATIPQDESAPNRGHCVARGRALPG